MQVQHVHVGASLNQSEMKVAVRVFVCVWGGGELIHVYEYVHAYASVFVYVDIV